MLSLVKRKALTITRVTKDFKSLLLNLTNKSPIFSIFLHYFDSKKGPNNSKVYQKCRILIKWYFGT